MSAATRAKRLLIKMIPYKFIRFSLKHLNTDFLFFGGSKKNTGSYLLRNCDKELNFYGQEAIIGQTAVDGFLFRYSDYQQHKGLLCEYILECKDCFIEPEFGWGITASNKLIFDSISNNAWFESYHPNYFKFKANKKNAVYYPEIISLRIIRGGESNYWHFIHDLLGQLALAKEYGLDAPVAISRALSEMDYFKKAMEQSAYMQSRQWVVQDKQYIHAGKAYFLQVKLNAMKQFFGVLDLLQIPDSDSRNTRKIFLTRNNTRIRFLENADEIEAIAKQHGFEIIDTDHLDLPAQIKLFGEASHVIGIHGAGLTNIMYRKNAILSLLELLPADYLEPHYFWLSNGLRQKYTLQLGSTSAINTSFTIDPILFDVNVKKMLEA